MKKIMIVLAATALLGACRNQEKTASEAEQAAAKPIVVEKKVYVPVQTQPATTTQQKKGWSKAAKGAAIGAGSGALVGVAVSDKKGKGAVIGGIVGAGAGYLIGRDQDKKDGRVKPKN